VELNVEGKLVSVRTYADGRSTSARLTDASLLSFSRLADTSSIVEYAKRYGVLHACEIDPKLPNQEAVVLPDQTVWRLGADDPEPLRKDDQHGREPLALWLLLASRLRSVLRINAELQGHSKNMLAAVGSQQDWSTLGWNYPMEDVSDAQFLLLAEVNRWLRLGQVRLELGIVSWGKPTLWDIGIGFKHLPGALAYQLLLMVAGESRLYACDNCHIPYIRLTRTPRPGQENFCSTDCAKVSKIRATQRFRERRKAKRKKPS
jgi:hypothetical protein